MINIYELELIESRIEKEVGVDTSDSYDHYLQNVRSLVIGGLYNLNNYLKLYREFCEQVKEAKQ